MSSTNIDFRDRLIAAGLRPTRQRLQLAAWLFAGEDKHFTAEELHRDVRVGDSAVSLATVYNTLSAFTNAGLLNTVTLDAGRVYYDTNTTAHFHLCDEDGLTLTDVDAHGISVDGLPDLPDGQVIDRIDIIIRTKKA